MTQNCQPSTVQCSDHSKHSTAVDCCCNHSQEFPKTVKTSGHMWS